MIVENLSIDAYLQFFNWNKVDWTPFMKGSDEFLQFRRGWVFDLYDGATSRYLYLKGQYLSQAGIFGLFKECKEDDFKTKLDTNLKNMFSRLPRYKDPVKLNVNLGGLFFYVGLSYVFGVVTLFGEYKCTYLEKTA